MGQEEVAFAHQAQPKRDGIATVQQRLPWHRHGKAFAVALGGAVLLGLLAFGLNHEAGRTRTTPLPAASDQPPHSAFTRAEEAYIQALWPVHAEVETVTARISLGVILYKTEDVDRANLKNRIDTALATYRNAEARINALQPPPSLRARHDTYLAAVRQFEASAIEASKMFDDGNEDHLLASYRLRQAGTDRIREIGGRFWRDEFPPN